MGPEISPVKAPSLAQPMFCAPMRMRVPWAASTAAARFVKGGQITISQCSACPASGRNFSKNAVVSAGVLYIFQLPAMTGFLIRSPLESWRRARCCAPKFAATVWPISDSEPRSPRFTPRGPRGPKTSSGTYSRVWSVPGVVGSQPWSAVKMARSPSPQRGLELRQPGVQLLRARAP